MHQKEILNAATAITPVLKGGFTDNFTSDPQVAPVESDRDRKFRQFRGTRTQINDQCEACGKTGLLSSIRDNVWRCPACITATVIKRK